MDAETVKTMMETGHATVAHIASHFDKTLAEVNTFLSENDIVPPTALHSQYRHIGKLVSAQKEAEVDWEGLVWDDDKRRFLNGIDTLTTDGRINANDILKHYHPEDDLRCVYTNEITDTVMAADGNPQNFLVTNLIPIDEKIVKERKFDQPLPMFIVGKEYTFVHDGGAGNSSQVKVGIHLHGRFDAMLGATFNELYIDAVTEQWLRPWFDNFGHSELLGGLPPTAELLALWVWRHLSIVAFLKGMARVEVERNGVSAFVTKDSYMQMVVGLMQRAAQSRAIATAPSIITPQQAAAAGLNQRGIVTP